MKVIILILVFPVIYCDWSLEPKEIDYIYKRTECKRFNPKLVEKVLCPHQFVNRSIESHLEVYIRPELKIDKVYIELTTHKKFGTVYRPTMIKLKENLCDTIINKTNSFFAQQIRNLYSKKITNFLVPCPMMGRKYLYGLKNSTEKGATLSFPPLIPIGDWKINMELTTHMFGVENFLVEFIDVYEVRQKSATQF